MYIFILAFGACILQKSCPLGLSSHDRSFSFSLFKRDILKEAFVRE